MVAADSDQGWTWPEHFVGSISHSAGAAVAVVARDADVAAIGVDVEMSSAISEELWSLVLSEREMLWILECPPADRTAWATVIFCAKEAFYKAQSSRAPAWMGFPDIEVTLSREEHRLVLHTLQPMLLGYSPRTAFNVGFNIGSVFTVAVVCT